MPSSSPSAVDSDDLATENERLRAEIARLRASANVNISDSGNGHEQQTRGLPPLRGLPGFGPRGQKSPEPQALAVRSSPALDSLPPRPRVDYTANDYVSDSTDRSMPHLAQERAPLRESVADGEDGAHGLSLHDEVELGLSDILEGTLERTSDLSIKLMPTSMGSNHSNGSHNSRKSGGSGSDASSHEDMLPVLPRDHSRRPTLGRPGSASSNGDRGSMVSPRQAEIDAHVAEVDAAWQQQRMAMDRPLSATNERPLSASHRSGKSHHS